MFGMDDIELQAFFERISGTAIANQAALRCISRKLSLTNDNIILCVGDFVDPKLPQFSGLIAEIEKAIEEIVHMPWAQKRTSPVQST